jgi:hypothetical protein
MMPSEFDLIKQHFTHATPRTLLGVGDDAALIKPSRGQVLAVAADMLVGGRHFFMDADPESVGHKALAVNLSDMAAMGAVPRWATLGIALPKADERWVAAMSKGFMALARKHGVAVCGQAALPGQVQQQLCGGRVQQVFRQVAENIRCLLAELRKALRIRSKRLAQIECTSMRVVCGLQAGPGGCAVATHAGHRIFLVRFWRALHAASSSFSSLIASTQNARMPSASFSVAIASSFKAKRKPASS